LNDSTDAAEFCPAFQAPHPAFRLKPEATEVHLVETSTAYDSIAVVSRSA
jgi:hypothetical protein